MAGARLTIEHDDTVVLEGLNRLLAATRDMTPLMRDIGEELLNTTRERFNTQTAPDGTPVYPPRGRGTSDTRGSTREARRFIPARAGNTLPDPGTGDTPTSPST